MIRFLADASLHDAIVTGCLRREPAIDFLSAHEATLEGVPDPEVLAFATRQNRIAAPQTAHPDSLLAQVHSTAIVAPIGGWDWVQVFSSSNWIHGKKENIPGATSTGI